MSGSGKGEKKEKKTPIEKIIDKSVRCVKCGVVGVGNCNCWDKPKREGKHGR